MSSFVIDDSTYPLWPWLVKNLVVHTGPDVLTNKFDTNHCTIIMIIENAFRNFKLKWKICVEMTMTLASVYRIVIC